MVLTIWSQCHDGRAIITSCSLWMMWTDTIVHTKSSNLTTFVNDLIEFLDYCYQHSLLHDNWDANIIYSFEVTDFFINILSAKA